MPLTITPIGRTAIGRDSWATDERPGSFADGFSMLWPNEMPLLALTSHMKKQKETDQEYKRFFKDLPYQAGTVTDVFTNATLATPYAAGISAVDTQLFVKMAAATAKEFRKNHHVILVTTGTPGLDVPCRVVEFADNGALSYLEVRTLKAMTVGYTCAGADWIVLNSSAEGNFSSKPQIINYQKYSYTNYIQTFRTNLGIDDATMRTKLRTGDPMAMEMEEKQMFHGMEIERAFLRGTKTKYQNGDNQWVYSTGGVEDLVKETAPENILDFSNDAAHIAETWDYGGYDWMKEVFEQAGRYGTMKRFGLCGSGFQAAMMNLMETHREIKMEQRSAEFGIDVMNLFFGPLNVQLKIHPLMTHDVTRRNSCYLLDMNALEQHVMQETKFTDQTDPGDDGEVKGYTTKIGMGFKQTQTFHVLHNAGVDGANVP